MRFMNKVLSVLLIFTLFLCGLSSMSVTAEENTRKIYFANNLNIKNLEFVYSVIDFKHYYEPYYRDNKVEVPLSDATYEGKDKNGVDCYSYDIPYTTKDFYWRSENYVYYTEPTEMDYDYNFYSMGILKYKSESYRSYYVNKGKWGVDNLTGKTKVKCSNKTKTIYRNQICVIQNTFVNPVGIVKYKSSNRKIVDVSDNGKILGRKAGKATITVSNNGAKDTMKVTVKNPTLSHKSKVLKKGKSFTLKIKGQVGNAQIKTTNKKVVSIGLNGKITAVNRGKAVVQVKTNGVILSCKITVK